MDRYNHRITVRVSHQQYQVVRRMPGDSDPERLRAMIDAEAARAQRDKTADADAIADAVAARLEQNLADTVTETMQPIRTQLDRIKAVLQGLIANLRQRS